MRLRRFTQDDGRHLFDLDADPAVMRYLTGGAPTPRAAIDHEILPRFLCYDPQQPIFGFWAAEDRLDGTFLGWFSLRPAKDVADDPLNIVCLGYRLRRAVWGCGYATEGVRALIRLAFAQSNVNRVVATTYEENVASWRVMEKAGMRLRRRFRFTPADLAATDTFQADPDELWDGDDLEYALTRREWERLAS